MEEREELITDYFRLGLTNLEIRSMLAINHRLLISERHLKRVMSHMNLFRRKNRTPLISVLNFIEEEIHGPGQLHGYRWMHHRCRQNGLNVSRETVRLILSAIDPEGVEHRRRRRLVRRRYITRGPNFVWHIDGYDKLKPYGVAIHGCVDGFSRKVIWLNAYHTNNNPRVIAGYYIEAISMLEGCPRIVRGDRGTENSYICQMQRFLRRNGADAQVNTAFIYGTSTLNQRIESFWSVLRKHFGQFWIDLFGTLQDEGYYTGDELDKNLIRLCFMNLLQAELDKFALEWNFHYIRRSRIHHRPFGRPYIMNMLPVFYNAQDYLYELNQAELDVCREECEFRSMIPCDEDIFQLCDIIIRELNMDVPEDVMGTVNLYLVIRETIRRELGLD